MPRFNAHPPNGDSRRAIQERARQATRPAAPEKKGQWPFALQDQPEASDERRPAWAPGEQGRPLDERG